MSSAGIPDPLFHAVAARYAGRVHLEWEPIDEASLRARARSSDICVFPSKFELDTFLIAQGEAMACGAVPVASAQEGMRHYCHHLPLDDPASTGFAVNRSFIADDPRLVEALVRRLREALSVLREDPTTWGRLRRTATATARTFTWEACADRLLGYFTALLEGRPRSCGVDDLLAWGWFEELPEDAWLTGRADIAVRATELGDLGAYRRCAEVDEAAARRLFEAAFCRGDIPACAGIVEEFDLHDLRDVLAARCCVTSNDGCLNVVYRHPFGERVEVFTPEASEDSGPRWRRHELAFEDGSFWGTLAEAPSSGVLPVLLTLRDGRATWDEVSYG